ncbi:hypothetical protein SLS64_005849 [Diaporthe eres]
MKTSQAIIAVLAATAYGRVARRANFADGDGCIAAQALADGIQSNIDLQTGEQASVEKVKAAVSQNPVDTAAFTAAKSQLLDFVNAGISARENNQAIAPQGNAAIDGLGIVQNAQAEELNLAQSLIGQASDLDIVSKLETDFAGGIKQNQQNAADALKGCANANAGGAAAANGTANAGGGKANGGKAGGKAGKNGGADAGAAQKGGAQQNGADAGAAKAGQDQAGQDQAAQDQAAQQQQEGQQAQQAQAGQAQGNSALAAVLAGAQLQGAQAQAQNTVQALKVINVV